MTGSPGQAIQVPDDRALLERMMADMEAAEELYRPTNYWKSYEHKFLNELRRKGLTDFRRRRHTVLESFGATDTCMRGKITPSVMLRGASMVARVLERVLWRNPLFPLRGLTRARPEEITAYFFHYVRQKFDLIQLDLAQTPTSRFGNPEDVIEVNSRAYSLDHLNYCAMVADAARYITFRDGMRVCELGSGLGRNIEILGHLFPLATLLSFDIPPQLYVSNQYLSSVFGERVTQYSDALNLNPEEYDFNTGKIVILPSWLMPKWASVKVDLFWNSASFQEMEPPVVSNYLKLVKGMAPRYIYINALPQGNYWGPWSPGKGGTKEPVPSTLYFESLRGAYALAAEYDTDYFLKTNDYRSYIFERIV